MHNSFSNISLSGCKCKQKKRHFFVNCFVTFLSERIEEKKASSFFKTMQQRYLLHFSLSSNLFYSLICLDFMTVCYLFFLFLRSFSLYESHKLRVSSFFKTICKQSIFFKKKGKEDCLHHKKIECTKNSKKKILQLWIIF